MLEKVLNLQIRVDQSTYREAKKRIDDLRKDIKVKFGKLGIGGLGGGGGAARTQKSWAHETAERQIRDMARRQNRLVREAKAEENRRERERIKKIQNDTWYEKEAGFDPKKTEYKRRFRLGLITKDQFTDLMQKREDELALEKGGLNQQIEENKPSPEEKQEEQRKEQRQRQYDQRGGIYSQPVTQRILRGIFSGSWGSVAKAIAPIGAAVGAFKLVSGALQSANSIVTPIRMGELMRGAKKGSTYSSAMATGIGTSYSKFTPTEMGEALTSALSLQMNSLFHGANGFAQSLGIDPFQSEEDILKQVQNIAKDAQSKGGWYQKQVMWGLTQAGFDPKVIMKLMDEAPATESILSGFASDYQTFWGALSGQTGRFPDSRDSRLSAIGAKRAELYTQDPNRFPNITSQDVLKYKEGAGSGGGTTSLLIQSLTVNGTGDPKLIADETVKAIRAEVKDAIQQVGNN